MIKNLMKGIVEAVSAPLVTKLFPILYSKIKEELISEIRKVQESQKLKMTELQQNLTDLQEKLEVFESTNKEQLAEIGVAIKSVYELVSSIIHINSKN